jgi:hypothetical protein
VGGFGGVIMSLLVRLVGEKVNIHDSLSLLHKNSVTSRPAKSATVVAPSHVVVTYFKVLVQLIIQPVKFPTQVH